MKNLKVIILLVVAISIVGWFAFSKGEARAPGLNKEPISQEALDKRLEDITYLPRFLEFDKSYSPENRKRAEAYIEEVRRNAAYMSEAAFYLAVRKTAALADNGHTRVSAMPAFKKFDAIPLRVYWFGDDLRIVRAHKDLADIVGGRITHINGVKIAEVADILGQYTGGHKHFGASYITPLLVASPAILSAAGIGDDDHAAVYMVAMDDGTLKEKSLVARSPEENSFFGHNSGWRNLIPEPSTAESNNWVSALPLDVPLPAYLQQADAPFFLIEDIGGGIAYVNIRHNDNKGDIMIMERLSEYLDVLREIKPKHVIVDVRHNSGGNLHLAAGFMFALHDLLPDDGLVFSITGKSTFSAGIYTAFYTKVTNPERTIVIGEHVADREVSFGETGELIELPNSGYLGVTAIQKHNLATGCKEDICHLSADNPRNIAVGSVAPDVEVLENFQDFLQGKDTILAAIFKYLEDRAVTQ